MTTRRDWLMFNTPGECADAAAYVFAIKGWRWDTFGDFGICSGIPKRNDILKMLASLQQSAGNERNCCSSGRVCFWDGRFGHQAPGVEYAVVDCGCDDDCECDDFDDHAIN